MNSFLTAKFDKYGKNKHDVFSRKVSNAQEKVRGMLKAEFIKWLLCTSLVESFVSLLTFLSTTSTFVLEALFSGRLLVY